MQIHAPIAPTAGAGRTSHPSGALGRLGAWTVRRRRSVILAWCVGVVVLGAFAPFADHALSGAGWEAPGSESALARRAIQAHLPGRGTYGLSVALAPRSDAVGDRPGRAVLTRVARVLRADPAVRGVTFPRRGVS